MGHLSAVPAEPYIHSAWPNITWNAGGSYPGTTLGRAAVYRGAWTVSLVPSGAERLWGPGNLCQTGAVLLISVLVGHGPAEDGPSVCGVF